MTNEYDIVKKVLYGNRENVNIIHEIFRQVHFKVLINLFSRYSFRCEQAIAILNLHSHLAGIFVSIPSCWCNQESHQCLQGLASGENLLCSSIQ